MSELHPLGNTLLRTPETFEKYHNNPKRESDDCFICDQPTLGFYDYDLWKLTMNEFPYDAVAQEHLLLSPVRHVGLYTELTVSERVQLEEIKEELSEQGVFDTMIENLTRGRTFLAHYHVHIVQWKRV